MFTLFDLIRVLAIVGGAVFLGAMGWNTFGVLGCVLGVAFGFVLGGITGQLPLLVCLKWISRRFDRMTDVELVDEFHDRKCLISNILLLELKRRSCNIQRELPFVHNRGKTLPRTRPPGASDKIGNNGVTSGDEDRS